MNPGVFLDPGASSSTNMAFGKLFQEIQSFLRPANLNIIEGGERRDFLFFCFVRFEFFLINRQEPLRSRVTNTALDDISFQNTTATGAFEGDFVRALPSVRFHHLLFQFSQDFGTVRVHTFFLHIFANLPHGLHGAGRQNIFHRFGHDA